MNVPKLRFGEFEDEWQDSTLGDVSKVTSGGTPNRANNEFWNGSIPWVSTALIDFNVIKEADEFITEDGLNNSSAKLFPKNTLLMAMYGQGKTRVKLQFWALKRRQTKPVLPSCSMKKWIQILLSTIYQGVMMKFAN